MNRVVDAMIAGVLLALTLPLIVVVAIAIRMDSAGPVFDAELTTPLKGLDGRYYTNSITIAASAPQERADSNKIVRTDNPIGRRSERDDTACCAGSEWCPIRKSK